MFVLRGFNLALFGPILYFYAPIWECLCHCVLGECNLVSLILQDLTAKTSCVLEMTLDLNF
jgi:hypothetical protein